MSMIQVEHLTFSYPSSYDNIFEDVSFQMDTDWKLGFVGRNGRGKTTFLRLLRGEYPYSGKIHSTVQFDYFPYPVADKSAATGDVLRTICPQAEEWELMRELSYLAVDAEAISRPFGTLSNGEQTKVLLAALFLREGNFLLIDEPTNHLDLPAREGLEKALKDFDGTLIFVSHDRYFISALACKVAEIEGGKLRLYDGGYESYNAEKKRLNEIKNSEQESVKKSAYHRSGKERAEEERKKQRLKKLEADIAEREREEQEINAMLSDPQIAADYIKVNELLKKLEGIKLQLDMFYKEYGDMI